MTRVRAAVAWLLLAPLGTVLLAGALVLGSPAALVGLLGVWCWRVADRLLLRKPDVGDDVLAMLASHHRAEQDELWRAWLSHPSVRERARRQVRGER